METVETFIWMGGFFLACGLPVVVLAQLVILPASLSVNRKKRVYRKNWLVAMSMFVPFWGIIVAYNIAALESNV